MKTIVEQSSEAPKSPVLPVIAEVVTPHEAETVVDATATSPVKTSEAATLEAEKPKESVVETEDEEVDEEIHMEGPYDVPPSPPPQQSTLPPPRREVRREESSSRSAPTGKGTFFYYLVNLSYFLRISSLCRCRGSRGSLRSSMDREAGITPGKSWGLPGVHEVCRSHCRPSCYQCT